MYKQLIIHNNKVNMVVRLSFLVIAFVVGKAQASECDVVEFLKNKSQAIQVKNNSCASNNKVSLGTGFVVAPSGRLWLKVNATENTDFQLICQNRGSLAVDVKYYSPFLPWIKPEKVAHCDAWIDNKLSCTEEKGVKNSFICAIAVIKKLDYLQLTTLERTTSVKMRNMGQKNDVRELVIDANPENIQVVTKAIKSEVNLCHILHKVNQFIGASWLLNTVGQVEKLSFANGKLVGKDYLSCIESAVHGFAYPRFTENVMFVMRL